MRSCAWGRWSRFGSVLALALAGCATPPTVARPEIIAPAAWGSKPDAFPASARHTPVRITVHHAGVLWHEGDDPFQKIRTLQAWGKREHGWPDVPYHFLIAPDGRIFGGRSLEFAGDTNTEYDPHGHALVELWGNFEVQRVSLPQLRAAVQLMAWLCAERNLAPSTIAGHRDWSKKTVCPGKDLQRYIAGGQLRRWVTETLRGKTPMVTLLP